MAPSAPPALRRVYWETTAGCNLRCAHCRRTDVWDRPSSRELSLEQSRRMVDDLADMGKPVLILSGGEPLFRRDIFDIAAYATGKGLPTALATNGTLVNDEMARKIKDAGIYYASVSLDGAQAWTHDALRGYGNFTRAVWGLSNLKKHGIKVQVNFTVTRSNAAELPELVVLARALEVHALYLFLLVPVGCGARIADSQMLHPDEVETWLGWIARTAAEEKGKGLEIRPICAPHYYRIQSEARPQDPAPDHRLGCLAGINICFVSHLGDVFPCGYLPLSTGNIKETPLSEIWSRSGLFGRMRKEELLEGKCGVCEYRTACGGCRARAYAYSGTELGEEPYCAYEPDGRKRAGALS